MIVLTIAGLYLLSSLVSTSEGALVQTNISGQLAAANGNLTALKTHIVHGVAAGPAYRGTFDIVWSCLLTIVACIYNAIHLNVPPRNTGKWKLLLRKVKWATMALFAPEIVLYTATTQFLDAYKVKQEVNAMRGQIRGKNKPELIDLRYGFYVAMGGFVYDVENLREDLSLVTLTPRGIITLAKQGQFVDISTEDITDKSKADIFTKSLICIQVSWMAIQCIARKATGYPLTLLEIHTMVHVVCALILYLLWWKKPYDIIEPTIIYAATYANYTATVALMLMGFQSPDRYSTEARYLCFDGPVRLKNNVNGLAVSGQGTSVANKDEKTIQILGEPLEEVFRRRELRFKLDQKAINPKPTVCMLLPGQYLSCGIGLQFTDWFFDLNSVDIRRWELCASAISEILKSTSPRNAYNPADTVKINCLHFLEEHQLDMAFAIHTPNFREDAIMNSWIEYSEGTFLLENTANVLLFLLRSFIPLTAAYGGIHLSAWSFEFPSRVESIIWRAACFIIIGSSFALLAVPSWDALDYYFALFYYDHGLRIWKGWRIASKLMQVLNKGVGYGSAGLLLLCYAASRLYLVVESLISLRHVPIGVYAAVPWVENIPHV